METKQFRVRVRDCGIPAHEKQHGSARHDHVLSVTYCEHGNVVGCGCRRCERDEAA